MLLSPCCVPSCSAWWLLVHITARLSHDDWWHRSQIIAPVKHMDAFFQTLDTTNRGMVQLSALEPMLKQLKELASIPDPRIEQCTAKVSKGIAARAAAPS